MEERERLEAVISSGKRSAQLITKARILLKADTSDAGDGWTDSEIAAALDASVNTVGSARRQLVEEGFEATLVRKYNSNSARPRIFDGATEAKLIALACSPAPEGFARWSLRLLEEKVVELNIVEKASDNTIGRTLKKPPQTSSPTAMGDPAGRQRRLRGRHGRRAGNLVTPKPGAVGGGRCVGGPATAGRLPMGCGAACGDEVAKVRGVRGRRPLLFCIFAGDTPFPGRFRRRGVAPFGAIAFRPAEPASSSRSSGVALADCQTARDCMSRSGVAVRTCRMLKPCFLAVDTTDLRSAKIRAPSRVRKPPEIFILTFIIRRSCSARLLVKGTSKSVRKRSVSVLNFFSLSSRLWPGRCLRRPRVFDFVSNAGSPR